MQPTPWQRMDGIARRGVPVFITVVLMLFAVTPTHISGLAHITPMYPLMAVYFWSIYRPDLLGFGACFGIGLLEDLLVGTPLGSGALVLLLCQWAVLHQQKFFNAKPFGVIWITFGIVAAVAAVLRWMCVGLVADSGFTPFGDLIGAYFMTMAVFPLVAWLLAKAQNTLLTQT